MAGNGVEGDLPDGPKYLTISEAHRLVSGMLDGEAVGWKGHLRI